MNSDELLNLSPEQITAIRIRERLKGLPAKEIVKRWYMSQEPFELTEQEERIRERWDWAKAQFLKRKKFGEIRDVMVEQFGIGPATAARDMRDALDCFGDLDRVPIEAHRQRAIQMALSAYNAAKKEEDGKAMAAATKVYMEAAGLDKDDSNRIDIERMMKERVYVEAPVAEAFIATRIAGPSRHTYGQGLEPFDVKGLVERALPG